jgi:hypothetical protein
LSILLLDQFKILKKTSRPIVWICWLFNYIRFSKLLRISGLILWSVSVKVCALQDCVISTYWICGFLQLWVRLLVIDMLRYTGLFFPHNNQLFLIIVFKLNVYNTFLILVYLILCNVHSATFLGNFTSNFFFFHYSIVYPWFWSI